MKEISAYSFFVFLTIIVDRAFWSTGQFILGMLNGTKDVAVYALMHPLLLVLLPKYPVYPF
ncbi:hypothetical protein RSW84_26710, partial [Escherichia coli]|uniref:hypothetical protein n=1 Tax=Escherichia coli TaxID=562 RepID=UPI0028DF0A2E